MFLPAPTVIIEAPDPKIMISPQSYNPTLRVACDHDVDVNLTFKWYHDNKRVDGDYNKYYILRGKSDTKLTLPVTNFGQNPEYLTGTYKCVVDDGIKNHTVSSLVELKPNSNGKLSHSTVESQEYKNLQKYKVLRFDFK